MGRLREVALIAGITLGLAGCMGGDSLTSSGISPGALKPLSTATLSELAEKGMSTSSNMLVRIFKDEAELEVWKETANGYALFKTYQICTWSGRLGPKLKQGDRQAPEGFYEIKPGQMNPRSQYYLSFNLGFPNTYDRSFGRTGSFLMVHGACASAGCYAMTNAQIEEIYGLARDTFNGGQTTFNVHAFPFRMTDEKMARYQGHEWFEFWRNIKQGYDYFERTRRVPQVTVENQLYVFNASGQSLAVAPPISGPIVASTATGG
ncbi:MAG: L,D-transpeptidase family protein [Alphaproteobacteria bacterium]